MTEYIYKDKNKGFSAFKNEILIDLSCELDKFLNQTLSKRDISE